MLFSSVDLVKNVLLLLLIIIFVNGGAGIFGPALAYLLVCPILFFIYLPATLRRFPFLRIKTAKFKETSFKVASFGIPLFATALGSKIIGYIDTLILTYFRTPFEVGVYNAILPTALTILYLGTAVATPMFPLASELWSRNQKEKLAQGMELIHRYMFTNCPVGDYPFCFC